MVRYLAYRCFRCVSEVPLGWICAIFIAQVVQAFEFKLEVPVQIRLGHRRRRDRPCWTFALNVRAKAEAIWEEPRRCRKYSHASSINGVPEAPNDGDDCRFYA
ncbi:hypothetical protein BOTBODRAFT_283284 [Botryobasidium botryosum FD-172 SS1]|uniref:Uncharacterized protein n=1 Tax=Botryobasidium botryosum (strain FD-172 SS1) TaxID=930990 RepID=A0A067MLK5_BOTB1|nr:hypothetical protein BOTBODRAFT_283284 [Botryobasidium botryosum FD-172 SS1]